MGLTKPRAAQIFNLDYKQSTRVVTATNITLTGGAPNLVDGVTLSLGDRVLVTGQNTGSQNGLYQVTTLGSGANGTWARTSDGNENGEIEAGMIVMVTEGTIYADTQWKLITDDPIVINTTALTFTQNYMANSISGGTSNVVVNSNANVTISSAGTANVLTVSNTGAFVSGVVSATGNVTGNYILGNGSLLTGVSTSSANINNGTSNVTVVSSGGDVTVGIAGTSNVAVFANTGLAVTGVISASGNVTGGNLLTAGIVSATGNITGGNITTGIISATGAVTVLSTLSVLTSITVGSGGSSAIIRTGSGTLANPAYTFGVDQDTGIYRITTNQLGISAGGTNAATFSNTAVNLNYDTTVTGTLSATGNVTGGNFLTAGLISATSTITSAANITGGNITTSGLITATGNVTGGNVLTAGLVSATGNLQAGNIRTVGVISATGNGVIAGRDLLVGAAYTSYSSAGRGIVAINGTTDQIVEFANGVTNYGYLYHSGTNMTLLNNRAGTIDVNATNGNINFVTSSSQRVQIDSTGIVSVTGNVQAGNLRTAGLITATGNVQAGNLRTAGLASATGNVTGGNVTTAGIITATGNATAGNILTGGLISATGLVVSNGAYMRANSQVVVDSYSGSSEGGQISLAWTGVNGLTGQGNGTWNLDVDSSNTFRTFYQNATGTTNVMFTLNSTNQTANFSGNIGASYYYGNGAFLTGITGGGGGGNSISNGATSINIPVSSGNISMSVAGQSNTVVINLGSLTMYGTFAGPKTLSANVAVANAVNAVIFGPVTVADGFNITVPDASTLYTYSGT